MGITEMDPLSTQVTVRCILKNSYVNLGKSIITVPMHYLYSFHVMLCSEHTNPLKHSLTTHIVIVAKDSVFWLSIVTSS